MKNDATEGLVLARRFGVEYLCADGHWYTGQADSTDRDDAINECRARWKAGALGVRVVEFRKSMINERVRNGS